MHFSDEMLNLAQDVVSLGQQNKVHIACAESCTGGLIFGLLTAVPGASQVMERGFITYTNESKIEMLGVDSALIETHGAISEDVVKAMAGGALRYSKADISVAVTGIAGPGGGTAEKPVGLVHIAIASKKGDSLHSRCDFKGDRHDVREQTVQRALEMLSSLIRTISWPACEKRRP